LCGAETWTVRAVDKKQLQSFEMWCWRRTEKISWTDHVRNEEVLLQVNEQRNILQAIRKRKAKKGERIMLKLEACLDTLKRSEPDHMNFPTS
jgi:hypothetical protein